MGNVQSCITVFVLRSLIVHNNIFPLGLLGGSFKKQSSFV